MVFWIWQRRMAWGSHSEKEMIIGKVIFEISRKNDVHNNYETNYNYGTEYSVTFTNSIDIYFIIYPC